MKRSTLTILILALTTICFGQTKEIKYFNNEWLQKEVNFKKGKFSKTIIRNADGSVTTEVKNIKTDETISIQTYKGEEPYGIWKYKRSNRKDELDYSFDLKYADQYCKDSISGVKEYFSNNDSLRYVAPIIEGGLTIHEFLSRHIVYPPVARENGIMGKVYLAFTLTDKGQIENIVITKSANIFLDKEAVRVIRLLKFTTPPITNGQAKSLCLRLPISFKLM